MEVEEIRKRARLPSVSSSINSSTASVRRRLAFLWRCCVCCLCNVPKCCRCCCCHKGCCCGCCCHEYYHRKVQTEAGASVSGSIDCLRGGSFEYIDNPAVKKPTDLPLDEAAEPKKTVEDPWSYIVMKCITPQWQDAATRLGMEKFVNMYPGTVLKERKEVPGNVFSAYDELMKLWSENAAGNSKESKDFEPFVKEMENLEDPKSPVDCPTSDQDKPTHSETSFCDPVSPLSPMSRAFSPADTSKSTLPLDRRISPTVEKYFAPDASTPRSPITKPVTSEDFVEKPSKTTLLKTTFVEPVKRPSGDTPTSPDIQKVPEKPQPEAGKEEEGSSSEEGSSEEDSEEESNTTTKRVTRIIRVDPDGNRKEFVYDGAETEDTGKLIEQAIADSPFSQEVDTEHLVKTATRRVVLKKEVIKRTVIRDGEETESSTVVETSRKFKSDDDDTTGDDQELLKIASDLINSASAA